MIVVELRVELLGTKGSECLVVSQGGDAYSCEQEHADCHKGPDAEARQSAQSVSACAAIGKLGPEASQQPGHRISQKRSLSRNGFFWPERGQSIGRSVPKGIKEDPQPRLTFLQRFLTSN